MRNKSEISSIASFIWRSLAFDAPNPLLVQFAEGKRQHKRNNYFLQLQGGFYFYLFLDSLLFFLDFFFLLKILILTLFIFLLTSKAVVSFFMGVSVSKPFRYNKDETCGKCVEGFLRRSPRKSETHDPCQSNLGPASEIKPWPRLTLENRESNLDSAD